jgi:hypothetical protein
VWVPHDVRDSVVDFVRYWSEKTEIGAGRFIHWLAVRASKFYDWRERYGRVNEHNGWIPRDFWLAPWEKKAIIDFHGEHPLEGYRAVIAVARKLAVLLHKLWVSGEVYEPLRNNHEVVSAVA